MLLRSFSFIVATALAVPTALAQPKADSHRPDIVVFLTDDQGLLDSSPYGDKTLATPNMQRIADAGLKFTRAFVASPSCAPSRAALLTGLMPAHNGAEPNHAKPRPEIKKWPAYFHDLGYEVVSFGKVAHYGQTKDYGFDHFEHDTFHDHECIPAAVEFLKNRGASTTRPLCICVGSNYPHVPWPETSTYDPAKLPLPAGTVDTTVTRAWRALYAAAVTQADTDFGKVYEAARAVLPKDTIYLFSSDHGAQWPFGKWNCYDAGIRVPLVVQWDGVIPPGSQTDAMVSWIDILPTLIAAAGGKPPENIDGKSFADVLRGRSKEHRDRIFTTHTGDGRWNVYPMRSLRTDRWKYIRNLHPEFAYTSFIDLPGKLCQREYWVTWEEAAKTDPRAAEIVKRYHQRPAEELYDLEKDPNEEHNLATDPAQASRLAEMRDEVTTWMKELGDKSMVNDKPRLLSDPKSFGPGAVGGDKY